MIYFGLLCWLRYLGMLLEVGCIVCVCVCVYVCVCVCVCVYCFILIMYKSTYLNIYIL